MTGGPPLLPRDRAPERSTTEPSDRPLTDFASPEDTRVWISGLSVVTKRWKALLLVVAVFTAVGVALAVREKPAYEAQALVELSRNNLAATLTGTPDTSAVGTDFTRLAETDATVAASTPVAREAIALAGAHLTPAQMLASSSVTASPDNNLLTFSVTLGSPTEATTLANAYATAYTRYQEQLDTAALQRAQRGIAAQINSLKAKHASLPGSLTARAGELQVLQALQSSNATLAKPAAQATKVRPKPVRNAAYGLIGGLFVGILVIFALEALDTRVTDDQELRSRLGWPLLGRLPEPPRHLRGSRRVASLVEPHGPDAEAARILRAQLSYSLKLASARRVIVTSALSSEGKSTTVANLAVAAARSGLQVVLIDLDLRKPTLSRLFDLDPIEPGLTDVIFSDAPVSDALQPVDLSVEQDAGKQPAARDSRGSLHVLASGPTPPSVGELMASDLVSPVLNDVDARADLVLIDAPPLLGIGDVSALAPWVDGLVIVTRPGLSRRASLEELRRTASALPAKVLGFVVAGVPRGHGYGYGYGYGYGDTTAPRPKARSGAEG